MTAKARSGASAITLWPQFGNRSNRESFPDATALLAECARRGLEGIVAKRKDSLYRSGTRSGWIKVKTEQWKAANRWRGEFFGQR